MREIDLKSIDLGEWLDNGNLLYTMEALCFLMNVLKQVPLHHIDYYSLNDYSKSFMNY